MIAILCAHHNVSVSVIYVVRCCCCDLIISAFTYIGVPVTSSSLPSKPRITADCGVAIKFLT